VSHWTFHRAPILVAGPCVIEGAAELSRVADELAGIGLRLGLPVCLKASFDKANRSRLESARGPGLQEGLAALAGAKRSSGLPVLTDVHEPAQARVVAEVVDAIQVPAFLCRQTDLLTAVGATGLPVNLKKGQWMAPEEMSGAVEKVKAGGCHDVAVTERGTAFGYGDLVVDMRVFDRLHASAGIPVLFDATHAVQQPGRGEGGSSGGVRRHVPALLFAAASAGADGFYLETHPEPASARSDAATQWPLAALEELVARALEVWHAARALLRTPS